MKILKWCFVFAIAFMSAWILIFTFTQDEFSASAPIKIFRYTTAAFPIYVFVASAFGIGLLIGFIAAAYYYVAGQAGIHNKKKEIKKLETSLFNIETELYKYREAAEKSGGQKDVSPEEDFGKKKDSPPL